MAQPDGGCVLEIGSVAAEGAKRMPAILPHGRSMWPTPRFSRRAMR
jgi:hypothetical protein